MSLLIVVLCLVLVIIFVGVYQKCTNAVCESKKNLKGKTVLVTGGTSGMGLEIALDFAYRNSKVIIACPFIEEGENARKMIIEKTGNKNVLFKFLDLSSLESVRSLANDILENESRLDILVNNAGLGCLDDYHTRDGINFTLQVNYFGHFLLTLLLLPLLRKSGNVSEPARIVNTSSVLHWIGKFDRNNLNRTGYWNPLQLYGNSKLFLILFSQSLAKKLEGSKVVVNSVDPGAVGTRIFDCLGSIMGFIIRFIFAVFFKSVREGCQTALYVALSSEAAQINGGFFKNCKHTRPASWTCSETSADQLWDESIRLVQLSDSELLKCLQSAAL